MQRMRWYNPSLGGFEWRQVPESDEQALSLLDGYPGAEDHVAVYQEWRDLKATIVAALIRAGESAYASVPTDEPSTRSLALGLGWQRGQGHPLRR